MKYGVIMADVPWSYSVFSKKGEARSASQHYDTMSLDEICALPVEDMAARDCHLFFWCTGQNIVRGDHVPIIRAWGFEPSAMAFVWIKAKKSALRQGGFFLDEHLFGKGMGHTTRQNAEFVILGRRGSPKRMDKSIHQIIVAPRREHSRKPDEIYERIEAYAGDVPRIELFARQKWPGWDAWGNEVGKFDPAPERAVDGQEAAQ